jgi:hypothetical protein
MEKTPEPNEQEPTLEPGIPLRPDPGYPETRGGTRDMDAKDDARSPSPTR